MQSDRRATKLLRRVELRDTRLRRALLIAFGVLLVGSACTPEASPPKNLILISIDTLVPGRMSLYGGPRETTPHIDALARSSVRFDNAFTPAPWTLPAHASMLSGLYPSTIYSQPGQSWSLSRATLLAQRFGRQGYRTGAVTGGGFVSEKYGTARGFESFDERTKARRESESAVDLAIAWLETHRNEPFFYLLHTYIVHEPYLDQRYVQPGQGGRLRDFFTLVKPNPAKLRVFCCQDMDVTKAERRYMEALYDGGVAAADDMVGRLLEAAERLQLLEDTAIIITSDHGQEFWRHTRRGGHGHTLYDDQLRVPLLWYEPRLRAAGTTVAQPVSLIDIVPTVVARFGLPAEDSFDGLDLSPLLDGGDWRVTRPLYAEGIHHGPERVSVRTTQAKLILTPDPNDQLGLGEDHPVSVVAPRELYLAGDAEETENLASSPGQAALLEELDSRLKEFRGAGDAGTTRPQSDAQLLHSLKALAGFKQAADPGAPALDIEMLKQLRELGYVE